MRKILLMVGFFLNSFAFCQVVEDFNDGELLHHPQWVKDTGRFWVNTQKQLQSKTLNKSDTAFIATSNQILLNGAWEFYVQLNTDPSTSNQLRIYLSFNQSNLDSTGNGYFLQIGETGASDSYDLYKKTGKTITKIIDGPPKTRPYADTIKTWFYIIHRVDGYWELYSRANPLNMWNSEGSCYDRTHRISNFMGISIKHTSTRSDKFLIDNIQCYPYELDTSAPEYVDIEIIDSTINVLFSEEIDTPLLYNISAYTLNNTIKPVNIQLSKTNSSLIQIKFNQLINGGRLTLEIPALSDLLGNKNDTSYKLTYQYIAPIRYQKNDVFISEFLPDPTPPVDLPESEFIEWYNATNYDINIENWSFVNGSSSIKLKPYILKSKSVVIFCKSSDTSLWKPYGNVIGLSTWPSVNNTAGNLKILDPYGVIIDEVNYQNTWYKNKTKSAGGYTLECTQAVKECDGIYIWEASTSAKGGSPGKLNTLWNLNQPSFYVYQFDFLNDSSIYLRFSTSVDSVLANIKSNYNLNSSSIPKKIEKINDYYTEYILQFNEKFKNNKSYKINLNKIKTCNGTTLDEPSYSFVFRNSDDTSLIKINELMVDPSPAIGLAEIEYIELFNTTSNYVNLSSYQLIIGTTKLILPTYILKPNEYLLIGASNDSIELKKYGTFIGFNTFPSLSNSSATISLYNKMNRLIDRVSYRSSWYRDASKTDGGWSLELIDPYNRCVDVNRWTASIHKKGGSPGTQNSVAAFNTNRRDLSVKYFVNTRAHEFNIGFNKPIRGMLINPAQFYFVGPNMKLFFPDRVQLDSPYYEKLKMYYNKAIPNGNYNFICQYIPNCGRNDTNIIYPFKLMEMEEPEVEISIVELMADPSPSRGLPETEYIELINASNKKIPYIELYLADTKDTIALKIEEWNAGENLLLCPKSFRNEFDTNIHLIPLTRWLSIDNISDTISLLTSQKNLIDRVSYHYKYLPKEKQEGGYSFVKIPGTEKCKNIHSWQASIDEKGGSPGSKNTFSVDMLKTEMKVISSSIRADQHYEIILDEDVDLSNDIIVSDVETKRVLPYELDNGKLIVLAEHPIKEGSIYPISLQVKNCMNMYLDTILLLHARNSIATSDLLISEILFNPKPGGDDFIEMYNMSENVINIEDLFIANSKDTISLSSAIDLSNPYKYVFPGEYRVLSTNTVNIESWYNVAKPEHLIFCESLPSMPDENGEISLLSADKILIDKLVYSDKMHFSWLSETEGRSLERKELRVLPEGSQNWASASDNIGLASPTGTNSQFSKSDDLHLQEAWLSNNVLNPQGNPDENVLELNFNMKGETVFMNAKLFSLSGSFISEVMQGLSLKNSGKLTWDLAIDNKLVPAGAYILSIECHTESGKYHQYKLPFAVHY